MNSSIHPCESAEGRPILLNLGLLPRVIHLRRQLGLCQDEMQCPVCGTDNPGSAGGCVSCHTLLHAARADAYRQEAYAYARRITPGDRSYLQSAPHGRAARFGRMRYLTGSSSARPTHGGTKTFPGAVDGASTQRHTRTDRVPRDPTPGERAEPRMDDHVFPQGANNAYEKLHGLGPDFGEYRPPQRSLLRRAATMASVFIVGAGVGLAAAWWLHRPSPGTSLATMPSSPVRSIQPAPAGDARRPVAIRGISPSELPYDGAPPPSASPPAASPAASDTLIPATVGASSGTSVTESAGAGNSGASPVGPEIGTPAPQPAADADDAPNDAKTAKQGSASVVSAAPKRKNAARSDREIERIRRQADEELKKKTEHGRALNGGKTSAQQGARNDAGGRRNAAGVSMSRVSATRTMLARCDRASNFIRREFCRWRVCNGSWGRNGCPSYQHQAPAY